LAHLWSQSKCTHLIAKVIRISRAKFHCNRLTTVQDIQHYASLIFRHIEYACNQSDQITSKVSSNPPIITTHDTFKLVYTEMLLTPVSITCIVSALARRV